MATYVPPKRATAFVCYTALTDTSDTTLLKANPTIAATGDVMVSKDGGAFVDLATLPDVYPALGYAIRIQLSATEMTADNVVVYFHDAVGTEWCDQLVHLQTVAAQIDDIKTDTAAILADTGTDGVLLANDAITAAKIAANAITSSELDATATAEIAAANWAYSSRTLTQSAAAVTAAVAGSVLTITRGDTFSAALTNIGALTGYVSLDFTVKKNQDDTDANAILRIRKNATGLTDGLITINKSSTGLTATNGSITIDDEPTGDITIALAAAETDDLVAYSGYFYDVQMITATAVTTLTENICNVSPDVTRAVA